MIYDNLQMDGKAGGMIRLLRPNNLLFLIILLGMMEKYVAEPILRRYQLEPALNGWQLALLIAAIVLVAAGGYVINAYFDVKIDTINHPDQLIVTRDVSKQEAMRLFQVLTVLGTGCGLVLSYVLRSMTLATLFIMTPGILWFYSASYKRQFLIGNLIIAFLAALTPLMVAVANAASLELLFGKDTFATLYLGQQIYYWIGGFALFAFLTTWIREIVKDIEDQEGDRELECHTWPVRFGDMTSKVVVTLLIALTMAALSWLQFAVIPGGFGWALFASRFYLLLMVMFVCELTLLWTSHIPSDYRHAQLLMKFIMFMGTMYAFCVPTLLA